MSNDPYRDDVSDPTPGWGQDPAPHAGDARTPDHGPAPGYGSEPGWDGGPVPAGGRTASVGKRFAAMLIDAIGLAIVVALVLTVTGLAVSLLTSGGGNYLSSVIMAVAALAYFGLMEAGSGQTLGKRLLHLKVVREDGAPVTLQQAVMRRLPFYVGPLIPGFLGSLVGFGLVLAILVTAIQDDRMHQGLHDRWAKTRVIDV